MLQECVLKSEISVQTIYHVLDREAKPNPGTLKITIEKIKLCKTWMSSFSSWVSQLSKAISNTKSGNTQSKIGEICGKCSKQQSCAVNSTLKSMGFIITLLFLMKNILYSEQNN